MSILNSRIKITRTNPGESISGKVTAANFPNGAAKGQIVQIDGAATAAAGSANAVSDLTQLKFATGTRGFHLERDLLVSDRIPLEQLTFQPAFLTPDLIDTSLSATPSEQIGWTSARKVLELEVEGPDYLLLSSGVGDVTTGLVGPATPVGAKLSTIAGKLYVAQGADEVYGYLRAQLVPELAANTCRLLIETVN